MSGWQHYHKPSCLGVRYGEERECDCGGKYRATLPDEKSPAELKQRIAQLEEENRVIREAAASAAGVTERVLARLERADKVVKAAIVCRKNVRSRDFSSSLQELMRETRDYEDNEPS